MTESLLDTLKHLIEKHSVYLIYILVCIFIFIGVFETSGTQYLTNLISFFLFLIGSYWFFNYAFNREQLQDYAVNFNFLKNTEKETNLVAGFLSGFVLFSILLHYVYLGHIPAITAYLSTDYYEIVNIRRYVTSEATSLIRYLSSFVLKAILPFTLLYLLYKKKWLFYWVVLIVGVFYSFSLLQKSYIITLLLPVIILSVFQLRIFFLVKYIALIVLVLYALLYITNPQLRDIPVPPEIVAEQQEIERERQKTVGSQERNRKFSMGIYNRIVLIPGQMVSDWFRLIPDHLPYLKGCGYRFITPVMICDFEDYASAIYDILYPELAERGIQGSANVASFMYDYANFGWGGLILAAVVLAFLFFLIEVIFSGFFVLKLCINAFSILMLSSSAVTTTFFSGGWGLMIILFLLTKNHFKIQEAEKKT